MELLGRRMNWRAYRLSAQALFARMWRVAATREGGFVVALMLAALVVRLPLMTFHGYYTDLNTYVGWGDIVNDDFATIYTTTTADAVSANAASSAANSSAANSSAANGSATGNGRANPGGNPVGNSGGPGSGPGTRNAGGGAGFSANYINYPPGTPYLFGVVVYFYAHLASASHASLDTLVRQDGIGPFLAKIWLLLADLAGTLLLFIWARKRHSTRFALLAAASWAFSPALLYNGVIWGQTDALVALPLLAALFALVSEAYVLGGVSLALAILIKPQPVIFVPLMLLYLVRWAHREDVITFAGAGLLTGLVLLAPVLVPHFQLFDMLRNMQAESYNDTIALSSDAFNFWWLIGYAHQPIGGAFLGIKSGLVGDVFFGAVTLLCAVQVWRSREPVVLCFALAVELFGFFLFMGAQHERYLFLFIPLALASVIVAPRVWLPHLVALYLAGTALCLLNMFVGVGGGIAANGTPIPFVTTPGLSAYLTTSFAALSELLAWLHVLVFASAVGVLLALGAPPAALRASKAASASWAGQR
ncbi:MAG TPA: glycosyltransferase 87 family protein [Ktedonobacterales bacterium]